MHAAKSVPKGSPAVVVVVCCVVGWGSYFDHAMAWEKKMDDPNIMIVTYEELKEVDNAHI